MTSENALYSDLRIVKELLYDKCNLRLTSINICSESMEYSACSFYLEGKKIEYRASKITPTKTGQFVTIWKRNKNGVTKPFDIFDDLDFIVITSISGKRIGQFIFPKSILAEKGIITQNNKDGKRGIRVYPIWDKATNKQAEKTQNWQINYFVEIKSDNKTDLNFAKKLFNKN
jgi:hypothetical protein